MVVRSRVRPLAVSDQTFDLIHARALHIWEIVLGAKWERDETSQLAKPGLDEVEAGHEDQEHSPGCARPKSCTVSAWHWDDERVDIP